MPRSHLPLSMGEPTSDSRGKWKLVGDHDAVTVAACGAGLGDRRTFREVQAWVVKACRRSKLRGRSKPSASTSRSDGSTEVSCRWKLRGRWPWSAGYYGTADGAGCPRSAEPNHPKLETSTNTGLCRGSPEPNGPQARTGRSCRPARCERRKVLGNALLGEVDEGRVDRVTDQEKPWQIPAP